MACCPTTELLAYTSMLLHGIFVGLRVRGPLFSSCSDLTLEDADSRRHLHRRSRRRFGHPPLPSSHPAPSSARLETVALLGHCTALTWLLGKQDAADDQPLRPASLELAV